MRKDFFRALNNITGNHLIPAVIHKVLNRLTGRFPMKLKSEHTFFADERLVSAGIAFRKADRILRKAAERVSMPLENHGTLRQDMIASRS